MDSYSKALKKRLITTRLTAIISIIAIAVILTLYFLNHLNGYICAIAVMYFLGMLFTLNSTFQDLSDAPVWRKVNTIFGFLFFLLTFALIIYAFVSGNLQA